MNEQLKIIISAETAKLKQAMNEAKAEVQSFKQKVDSVDTAKIDSNFQKLGGSIKTALKGAATVVAGVGTALAGTALATEEYRVNQNKLNTAFEAAGLSASTAKNVYRELYGVLGDDDVAVEAANHLAAMGLEGDDLEGTLLSLTGVYAKFGDSLPIEGLTEAMNETAKTGVVTGSLADALNWAGISEDEFNEKLAKCNSEQERTALICSTLSGEYDALGKKYKENNAVIEAQRQAQVNLKDALAQLGTAMTPVITAFTSFAGDALAKVAPYVADLAENLLPKVQTALDAVSTALSTAFNWATQHQGLLAAIAIAIGVVVTAIGLYNAAAAVKAAMAAAEVASIGALIAAYAAQAVAMAAALLPYIAIAAAIAAVVAIIVVCVKHWDEIKAKVVEVASAVWGKVQEMVNKVKNFFQGLIDWVSSNWQGLLLLIVNPFAGAFKLAYDNCEGFRNKVNDIFGKIKDAISNKVEAAKTAVTNKFDAIKTAVSNKLESAKTAVSNKMDSIKNSIQNKLDTAKSKASGALDSIKGYFSSKLDSAKSTVSSKLSSIASAFGSKMETAKSKVQSAINKIKGFMNFSWSLPKLKMPHVSISGKFSLNPPSVPKFSISWYQLGGVFDNPTLFPWAGGIGGLGENGAEAIVPLEKNTQWLDRIAEMLNQKMGGGTPIILQVDGKTFAQTCVNSMNDLTRQTGSLQLKLV